jgi:hypothetical protein
MPIILVACFVAALAPSGHAKLPTAIRVGGPSAPGEAKVAVVGSNRSLAGKRFRVRDAAGKTVLRGRLRRAAGKPAPWRHAYVANISAVTGPGAYRIQVGRRSSRPWAVADNGSRGVLLEMLDYFAANRDGAEPSPIHGPAHLNDAVVHPDSPAHAGEPIALRGGWMDAGDMLHFTQTTGFATAMLEAAARLDPVAAPALEQEADVGVRWLVAAHPAADLFIAQVGDERDHVYGFRDPTTDDASSKPGIGTRFAYPAVGGDLGGKAAAALAFAYLRNGDPATLAAAREWYAAGLAAGAPAPKLSSAGYPRYAADFYKARNWKDSMAAGAVALYRATCAAGGCEASYEQNFTEFMSDERQTGAYAAMGAVDDFASFAAADACGALGAPAVFGEPARSLACERLRENGAIAVRQSRRNAFGMPGYFSWGTTAQNGAAGALAALATVAPGGPARGCATAAGARDWLLGRNPHGASFVVGVGAKPARKPHHWAAVFGSAMPHGAVVGGPAPRSELRESGFRADGRFDSAFASYEDRRSNYVTSEPAIDYTASSVLLMAALAAHC